MSLFFFSLFIRIVKKNYWTSEVVSFTHFSKLFNSQLAFTYSKLTIERLEQGVKYVQSTNSSANGYCHLTIL